MGKNFSIKKISFIEGSTFILISIPPQITNTSQIPGFSDYIIRQFPQIKHHRCHNGNDYSFEDEIKETELAHVFEHVLIEIISQKDKKADNIVGWTRWNWRKYPQWSYYIEVGYVDESIMFSAIEECFRVFKNYLDYNANYDEKYIPVKNTVVN